MESSYAISATNSESSRYGRIGGTVFLSQGGGYGSAVGQSAESGSFVQVKRRHHTSSGPAVGVNGGMGGRNVPPLSARRARYGTNTFIA